MFQEYLKKVREQSPIIHNITNYVTVNDCANILLACGASPIMADDINEVVDITSLCAGLNINIGTLNQNTIPSMFAAGRKANSMEMCIRDRSGWDADTLYRPAEQPEFQDVELKWVPYYAWANRGIGEMTVWVRR